MQSCMGLVPSYSPYADPSESLFCERVGRENFSQTQICCTGLKPVGRWKPERFRRLLQISANMILDMLTIPIQAAFSSYFQRTGCGHSPCLIVFRDRSFEPCRKLEVLEHLPICQNPYYVTALTPCMGANDFDMAANWQQLSLLTRDMQSGIHMGTVCRTSHTGDPARLCMGLGQPGRSPVRGGYLDESRG